VCLEKHRKYRCFRHSYRKLLCMTANRCTSQVTHGILAIEEFRRSLCGWLRRPGLRNYNVHMLGMRIDCNYLSRDTQSHTVLAQNQSLLHQPILKRMV